VRSVRRGFAPYRTAPGLPRGRQQHLAVPSLASFSASRRSAHAPRDGSRTAAAPVVSELRIVAKGLASAYLDGEWEPDAMTSRGRLAIGRGARWVRDLALAAFRGYADPPRDRPRELAAFLAACPPLRRAYRASYRDGATPLRIVQWFHPQTAMVRQPWPTTLLHTVADIEGLLGLSPTRLRWLADIKGLERSIEVEALRHYRYRWSPKSAGGSRLIEEPKPQLKHIQRVLVREILDQIPAGDAAHGFCRGRSALSYASAHLRQAVVVHLDLEDFFGSIGAGRVYGIFRQCGYPEPVAHLLTGLVTNAIPHHVERDAPLPSGDHDAVGARRRQLSHLAHPHLPQGAPTSPGLANLAAFGLDRRVSALARRAGLSYTRYADDLAFSSPQPVGDRRVGALVDLVTAIAKEEGFRINAAKTAVRRAGQRQRLAGIVVNDRPNVDRREFDRLKAIIHNALRSGAAAQNRDGHRDFRAHLHGRIAWPRSLRSTGRRSPPRTPDRRAGACTQWPSRRRGA